MHTFAQKPKATQQTPSAEPTTPSRGIPGRSAELRSILDLQRTIGNQSVQRLLQTHAEELERWAPAAAPIQTKSAINTRGDEYEQEADRLSDRVMRMPPSQEHERLPIKRVHAGDTEQIAASPTIDAVLAAPGQPLDPATRGFMESRFGHDFSQVRVHAGAAAERTAQELNARAYTAGHNIVFGDGVVPSTQEGRRLIAHELTHVVQQSRGAVQNPSGLSVQRQPDGKSKARTAPKAAPKPKPRTGLNRTLYVIHNDVWNKLPPAVRVGAEQELKRLFKFVGTSSTEKPFSIKVVTASQLPEQFDFSESVVAVIHGVPETYVNDAFARQDAQIKQWLAGQKVQTPAKTPGGKGRFKPDRIGFGGGSRSVISGGGKKFALPVMAAAVSIDEVIDSFLENIDSLLQDQMEALPQKGKDPTKWPPIVHSKKETAIWDPQTMLGVALAHAIAHEARHEYVGAGHAKTGLGQDSPFISGEKTTAQFSAADQTAILKQIHKLEATQGKATVVPTFPQSVRDDPEQFPF